MNETLICQSCSMPLIEEQYLGTNADGGANNEYCIYCFKDGKFNEEMTLEEFTEYSLQFAEQAGMTEEEMREHCKTVLPTLKRWKCTCTDECASGTNPNCTCTSSECHCTEE